MKKIIKKACADIITLNNWLSPKNWTPGAVSSALMSIEKAVPIIPENTENIKYKLPISLAFVEVNQFTVIFSAYFRLTGLYFSFSFYF